jgi:hypothetical protein
MVTMWMESWVPSGTGSNTWLWYVTIAPSILITSELTFVQVGQIPWVDYLWVKNPIVSRLRPARWSPMVQFALKQQENREAQRAEGKPVNDKDFLSRFIVAMEKDPSIPKW